MASLAVEPHPVAAGRWAVERWRGPAGDAHGRPWPPAAVPSVRLVAVDAPALVLGSTQRPEVVDGPAAARAGVAVVRRRSGGGAVLVGTGDVVWVDVFVPAGDRLWDRDVGRATHWLGRAWTEALGVLGVEARWHDGPLVGSAWSWLVCFAGVGPGEVRAGARSPVTGAGSEAKMVGISQRRTRTGALFQCATLLAWDPGPMLGILALDDDDRARARRDLAPVAKGLRDVDTAEGAAPAVVAAAVEEAFLGTLVDR